MNNATKLILKMLMLTSAMLVAVAAFHLVLCFRHTRVLFGFENKNMVAVVISGKAQNVSTFLDFTKAEFCDAYEWDLERRSQFLTDRRLLIWLNCRYPRVLTVSRKGVGIYGSHVDIWHLFGKDFLVCQSLEVPDRDVRDDMKGLDAVVEKRCLTGCVEYVVTPRGQRQPDRIVIRIDSALHELMAGETGEVDFEGVEK